MLRRSWPADPDRPGGRKWLGLAVGAALLAFVVPLSRRVLVLSDEGYLLQQSLDLLHGRLLYRDMDAFVTPGVWYALAGVFAVLEPSVLSSRLVGLASYLATAWLLWRIVAREAGRGAAPWAIGAYAVATVWSFPAWTVTFYSPVAMSFGLWALERLLAWRRERRPRDAVWCGVLLGLSILCKQNYGALASFGALAALLFLHVFERHGKDASQPGALGAAWRIVAGGAAVGVPVLVGFAVVGAMPALIDSLVLQLFEFAAQHEITYLSPRNIVVDELTGLKERLTYGAFAFNQTHAPFVWIETARIYERMHAVLYWLPPVVFAVSAWLVLRPRAEASRVDGALGVVWCMAAAMFLGVFPRADFNHLMHVYQPVLLLLVLTVQRLHERLRPVGVGSRGAAGLGIFVAAAFLFVAAHWYVNLLLKMNTPVRGERGGVLLAKPEAAVINRLVAVIREGTEPDDAVLTVPDLSMLNFLSERAVPSAYFNMYQVHIEHDGGAAVVAGSESAGVPLAVTRFDDFFAEQVTLRVYAPELASYLQSRFEPLFAVGRDAYVVHGRRATPLASPLPPEIVDGCAVVAQGALVRQHLLWSTLYHLSDGRDWSPDRTQTECRVHVPETAPELGVRIGALRPYRADWAASFESRILVRSEAGEEILDQTQIPIVARQLGQLGRPVPEERHLDLSPWAGEDVTLVFASSRRGNVLTNPGDLQGFGVYWQSPRLYGGTRAPEDAP